MIMSEADICMEYRTAKDPQYQRRILADLNLCTVAEIDAVLKRCNVSAPAGKSSARGKDRRIDPEAVMALLDQGHTPKQIGDMLGFTAGAIRRRIREYRRGCQ